MIAVKTFDTILSELCDNFDALIAPKTIYRSNTNVVYLILKAVAKGYELVNNVAVVLNNKFNPLTCSESDLESVSFLVGTQRLLGCASGLLVTCSNNSDIPVLLPAGTYSYKLDADTVFEATLLSDKEIAGEGFVQLTMLSTTKGGFPVTEQPDITVDITDKDMLPLEPPEGVVFSCSNNSSLLGYEDETDAEFRKRILYDTNRQDSISEIRVKVRNLPYVFDCDIFFNQTLFEMDYDGIVIPPYHMLLMVSGDIKDEIAEIVAANGIYPTVQTDSSTYVMYQNDLFAPLPSFEDVQKRRGYKVWVTPYKPYNFTVTVQYYVDTTFASESVVAGKIRAGLFNAVNTNRHIDIITDDDIFGYVQALNLTGVRVLGVDLYKEGSEERVNYLTLPKTRIPNLTLVRTSLQDLDED